MSASNLSEMVMEYIRLAWTSCQYCGVIGGQKFRSTRFRASAEVADDTLKQGDMRKMSKRAERVKHEETARWQP